MKISELPKKSLGQNFLIDQNIVNKIVKVGNIENSKIILEIGTEKNKEIIEKLFIKNDFQYKWHKDLNGNYRVIELYK